MARRALIIILIILASSCTGINSIRNPGQADLDGLVYHMPKKDVIVTMTIVKDAVDSIDIAETAAYPDMTERFVLRHEKGLVAKNETAIAIGVNSLLQSAKSTTTSQVVQAFKNLADGAGIFVPQAAQTCRAGTHSFIFEARPIDTTACGMRVVIKSISPRPGNGSGVSQTANKSVAGIFYRQNIPYKVSVTNGSGGKAAIIFSPSESPVFFLPMMGTVFSDNKSDFGLTDGVPTKYDQTTEGELLAVLKLPAEVFGAYFAAVGRVFDSFKSTDEKEAASIKAQNDLDLQKQKHKNCMSSIRSAAPGTPISSLACEE